HAVRMGSDTARGRTPREPSAERLPPPMEEVVDEFVDHLAHERGLSPHTLRAYRRDVESILRRTVRARAGGESDPVRAADALAGLSLADLRGWLAEQAAAGAARTTLARRTSVARTFTSWAARRGI